MNLPSPLTRLFSEIKKERVAVSLILLTGFLLSLTGTQFAIFLKKLTDSLGSPDSGHFIKNAGFILGLAFIQAILRYSHLFITDLTIERLVQGLRLKLQTKLLELPPQFYLGKGRESGSLMSRILNDMTVMQNGFRYFVDLAREPLLFIFLLSWLFYLNWSLTLSILIILPLLIQILKKLSQSVAKYSRLGQEEMEKVTQFIKENLDGIRVIQSFTLESYAKNKLQKVFQSYYEIRKKMHSRVHLASPTAELIAMTVGLGVVISIAFQIQSGQATYGDFTSYLAALLMLNRPIKVIQEAIVRLQEVKVATSRLYEILDTPSPIQIEPHSLEFPGDFKEISFENICFSYGNRPILKNINFKVQRGQFIAFVGPSGSGKSTLINLIPRFFEAEKGQLLIGPRKVQDINLASLRKNIAMVTQEVFLFSDSIYENIRAGNLNGNPEKIISAAKEASALDFIEKQKEGFQTPVGERGHFFSGGEKQRLSIARAIYKDAPILIFDEATSNLDSQNEDLIQKSLLRVAQGKTCFFVAHRLASIQNADCIYVLQDGEIKEFGTHKKLLDNKGLYFQLAQQQGLTV